MVAQPNNRLHGKQRAMKISDMGVAQITLKTCSTQKHKQNHKLILNS
jgi:hypothetical protein